MSLWWEMAEMSTKTASINHNETPRQEYTVALVLKTNLGSLQR